MLSLASLQSYCPDEKCTSHLVAIENKNLATFSSDTVYYDHKNGESNHKVTGAAFVVFNGALNTNISTNVKVSLIEDGMMIQIDIETLNKLKESLKTMSAFKIEASKSFITQPNDINVISIEWTNNNLHANRDVYSVIDGKPMHGIKSFRLNNFNDFANGNKVIRCTEVFIIDISEVESNESNFNLNKFAEMCSQGFIKAIFPILDDIIKLNDKKRTLGSSRHKSFSPFRIGLRVQKNKDQLGYVNGMNRVQINDEKILGNLDNEMVQILQQVNSLSLSLSIELVFYIFTHVKAKKPR